MKIIIENGTILTVNFPNRMTKTEFIEKINWIIGVINKSPETNHRQLSRWTTEEDQLLKKAIKENIPIDQISLGSNRTRMAIYTRIHRLKGMKK